MQSSVHDDAGSSRGQQAIRRLCMPRSEWHPIYLCLRPFSQVPRLSSLLLSTLPLSDTLRDVQRVLIPAWPASRYERLEQVPQYDPIWRHCTRYCLFVRCSGTTADRYDSHQCQLYQPLDPRDDISNPEIGQMSGWRVLVHMELDPSG